MWFTHWLLIIGISLFSVAGGLFLGYCLRKLRVDPVIIVEKIDNILPQSQCGQCGYSGCLPYAQAIFHENDKINKCVPGGKEVVLKLSELLAISIDGLDISAEKPDKKIALINESQCIGCTKCIQFCPVDAIVGTTKAVHTVISDLCTGCELCLSPCPTDCIKMQHPMHYQIHFSHQLTKIPIKIV